MTSTFEALQVEILAEEIYESGNRLQIPWSRATEGKRRKCREDARRQMAAEEMTLRIAALEVGI